MRYSITHHFDAIEDLQAHVTLTTAATPARKKAASAEEDDAPKTPAKKKPAPPPEDEPEGLDYETQVRPKIVKFAADFDREELMAVLGKFKNPVDDEPVTSGKQLDPSDWEPALAALAKARKRLAAAAD